MRILLVRHGAAVETTSAPTDHLRWLTDAGRRSMTGVGKALARLDLRYSCIYTSPLVRAVQTAEILAITQAEFTGPIEVYTPLSSDEGTTAQALEPLEHAADDDLIVMVTHMPKIEILAGHLCQMQRFGSFRTGSACLIRIEHGKGSFQWMLDPETLELRRA
ncbi:MAG: histidine phosphatase family protein [Myxococcales bacterium]|nr:histidine phosphatase family protein [Myxococcales bacterium]MDH3483537.1 histidine phosphatase family protein [Myxococcales bacterium]